VVLASLLGCSSEAVPLELVVGAESVEYDGKDMDESDSFWRRIAKDESATVVIKRGAGVSNHRLLGAVAGLSIGPARDRSRLLLSNTNGMLQEVQWSQALWVHIDDQGGFHVSIGGVEPQPLPNLLEIANFMAGAEAVGDYGTAIVSIDSGPVEAQEAVVELAQQHNFERIFWLAKTLDLVR